MCSATHVARLITVLGCIRLHAASKARSLLSEGQTSPDSIRHFEDTFLRRHFEETFAYAENVMSHPAVFGGHNSSTSSFGSAGRSSSMSGTINQPAPHLVHSALGHPNQKVLKHLAGRGAPVGQDSPNHILGNLKKTVAYAEGVMSHPAVMGGHDGLKNSAEKSSHVHDTIIMTQAQPVQSTSSRHHQSFLSQLATRSKRMSRMETFLVVAGVAAFLAVLTYSMGCIVKFSSGSVSFG